MEPLNPYASPRSDGTDIPARNSRRWAKGLCFAWTVVFLVNLAAPLLFGWELTERHGATGMFAAVVVLFVCGGWLCARAPKFGTSLVAGGALVALSQLFPILHVIAGIIAIGIANALGQVETVKDEPVGQIAGEAGGFLVTMTTGLLLLIAALALGLLVRALTPQRWRRRWDEV